MIKQLIKLKTLNIGQTNYQQPLICCTFPLVVFLLLSVFKLTIL